MTVDLRTFLAKLDDLGELDRVDRELSPRFEIAAHMKTVQERSNKALFFREVRGYDMPIVGNILGKRKLLAVALRTDENGILREWSRIEREETPTRRVTSGPCKEIVYVGDKVDLRDLPIVTHCEKDAGPYITAGILVFRKNDGKMNASFNRMQLVSRNRLYIRLNPGASDAEVFFKHAERNGKPLEAAVCVGNHPHLMLAAATKLPIEADELAFAGAIRGEPIDVTRCDTVDVNVPSEAEIVLEGRMLPGVRASEGPFGDLTGYYAFDRESRIFEVTAVTRREDSIYQTILSGSPEEFNLYLSIESKILGMVEKDVPGVRDAALVSSPFTYAVSIRKSREDDARKTIENAISSHPWVRVCIVVDDDVNPRDYRELLWAISTRCRTNGIHLFHASDSPIPIITGRIGIDATVPLGDTSFQRKGIPGANNIQGEYAQ